MLARLGSGFALAGGIIAVLTLTPWWGMGIVVLAAMIVSAGEYQNMAHPEADKVDRLLLVLACLSVIAFPIVQPSYAFYGHGTAMLVGFFTLAIGRLARPGEIEHSMRRLSADAMGFLYISLTFPYVFDLRGGRGLAEGAPDYGGYVLILVMACTFLSDTGAFFAGRSLGKHKLYPKISPKKTIEGVVGGVVFSIGGAFICRAWLPGLDRLSVIDCVILGIGCAIFGVIGDLVESMMKRAYGVKDSGDWIPGHGGALDRIDGLLFAGPFAWFYGKALGLW